MSIKSLCEAVEYGCVYTFSRILEDSPSLIDIRLDNGVTLFHLAASHDKPHIILKLVELGCTLINEPNTDGVTPLLMAVQKKYLHVAEILLQLGSTVDSTTTRGLTPIHAAAMLTNTTPAALMIILLLKWGSRTINTLSNRGNSPMAIAACNNTVGVIQILARHGCTMLDVPNNDGDTPLHIAAKRNHLLTVHTLKLLGADASDIKGPTIKKKTKKLLRAPIKEKEALEFRYDTYFQRSLSARLLFVFNHRHQAKIRFYQ